MNNIFQNQLNIYQGINDFFFYPFTKVWSHYIKSTFYPRGKNISFFFFFKVFKYKKYIFPYNNLVSLKYDSQIITIIKDIKGIYNNNKSISYIYI
jgi:hypothetical protein